MLTAYEIPGTQFSLPATTTIGRYRFVSIDAEGKAIQATASTDVIGVSRNEIDPVKYPDAQVVDIADGIMMVEAGAAITCGAKVASDANGKAIVATGDTFVGIAFSDAAAAGTIIAVKTEGNLGKGLDGKYLQTLMYTSADLAAGADLTDVPFGVTIKNGEILGIVVISTGAAAGIDDANTSVFSVDNGADTVASFTFNTANVFPAAGAAQELTLDETAVSAGDVLTLSVTNGATADLPIFMVQVVVALD
jgi:hypothetical protein